MQFFKKKKLKKKGGGGKNSNNSNIPPSHFSQHEREMTWTRHAPSSFAGFKLFLFSLTLTFHISSSTPSSLFTFFFNYDFTFASDVTTAFFSDVMKVMIDASSV